MPVSVIAKPATDVTNVIKPAHIVPHLPSGLRETPDAAFPQGKARTGDTYSSSPLGKLSPQATDEGRFAEQNEGPKALS